MFENLASFILSQVQQRSKRFGLLLPTNRKIVLVWPTALKRVQEMEASSCLMLFTSSSTDYLGRYTIVKI